jgi:hypothetical protein
MTLVITSKSFCFVAGQPCSVGDIEQLVAAIIGLGLFAWVTQAAQGKPLAEQPGALLRGLRDVVFLIPVPFLLWYDSLHPNGTVRIFAIALVLTEVQDVVRRRQAQRTPLGRPKKPISARQAAEGYSLIVDPRKDGGPSRTITSRSRRLVCSGLTRRLATTSVRASAAVRRLT